MSYSAEDHRLRAIFIVQQAITADKNGEYEEAFNHYMKAFEWFELSLKYEKNPKTFEKVKNKLYEYIQRAEEIKKTLGGGEGSTESHFRPITSPNVRWDDIGGLEEAKSTLRQTVIMPIKFPTSFKNLQTWSGILLYGPPGTGKSLLAKAVATEAKYTFLSVSASDLVSKYLGEGEKHVKELFETARKAKPSIIFIDEIESLCSQRDESMHEASSRLLTEFLVQMDGVGNDASGILVLAATNLPWMLDAAMIRRLEQKIYIPLPDQSARRAIFAKHVDPKDAAKFAKRCEGYSGADVAIIVKSAKMAPLRIVESATHFKPTEGGFEACSPGHPDAIEMTWADIPDDKLILTPVTRRDYYFAISAIKPSVDLQSLQKYVDWTRGFGTNGN